MPSKRIAVAVLALVAALALAPGAAAQDGTSRQDASIKLKNDRPGQSTGVRLRIDYVNPADPDAKPPAVQRTVTRPARTRSAARIDTDAPRKCRATDGELIAQGAGACPAGSRVGGGRLVLDTGGAGPARLVRNDVVLLNNTNELIFLTRTTDDPKGLRTVVRAEVRGRKVIARVPPIPGGPPDGFTAIDRVKLNMKRITTRRGVYIRTPRVCPAKGSWTSRIRFTYRDGVSQVVRDRTRCRR